MSNPTKVTRSYEEKFFDWMAKTRTGTMFKVAVSAIIMWALDDIASWEIPPVFMVGGVAVLTYVINEINPRDARYGIGSKSGDKDVQ